MKDTTSIILLSSLATLSCGQAASVVSVNFRENNGNPNQIIAATTVAGGGAGVGASNWNNVVGGTGSATDVNDDTGAATTVDLTWSSGGMWGDSNANTDADNGVGNAQLQRGYLDDNQGAPDPIQIIISSIPYTEYDLVVYFSTDTAGDNYGTITATDSVGANTGATSGTKERWGVNPNLDSTNSLRITGLTGDVTIDAPIRTLGVRHSISGLQIIQVPEPSGTSLVALSALLLLGRRKRS